MEDSNYNGCSPWELTLEGFQKNGHSFQYAGIVMVAMVLVTFIVSTLTKNYSQVDKLWSIVPFVYAWIVVCDDRTLLMAIVATIWGVRLTYNFSRRDGYKWPPWNGDEDYRWLLLQKGELIPSLTNPIIWVTFNFFFISLYQSILLLLIATPSMVAHVIATKPERCIFSQPTSTAKLNALDYVAAILIVVLVVIETVADNHQWTFQNEKYRRRREAETAKANKIDHKLLVGEYADGFCQSGLYAIVRKPNYAAEQSIWVVFYLFSVAASKGDNSSWLSLQWYNWSIYGWLLLLMLFQGSGYITEQITLKKYPKYADYMKRVPQYVPNPFNIMNSNNKSKIN